MFKNQLNGIFATAFCLLLACSEQIDEAMASETSQSSVADVASTSESDDTSASAVTKKATLQKHEPLNKKVSKLASGPLTIDDIKKKVKQTFPQATIDRVETGPIDGFFQVISQGEIFYVTADGKHMIFSGRIVQIENGVRDLTQEKLAQLENEKAPFRAESIDNLQKADFVTFPATKKEKHKITVFTDVDCGYCRKLHRDVPKLNEMGITVQYLAYPRAGVNSESYNKLVGVWCSDDQQQAMNKAKLQGVFEKNTCPNTIKDKHMTLVRPFGIRGTPAIVTENGQLMPGYLPPERLMAELDGAKKEEKK